MNIVFIVIASLIMVELLLNLWLETVNFLEVKRNADKLPDAFVGIVDANTYEQSVAYTLAKIRLGLFSLGYEAVILLAILLSGILAKLFYTLTAWLGMGIFGQALVLLSIMLVLSLPGIPLELWKTFKLEAKFGFNKSTFGLWLSDKLKGIVLSLLLGIPILALLLGFFRWLPETWWIWGFIALTGYQLLLMVLWPRLIMPLFNKLEPLAEGTLRDRLLALGERTGFTAKTIQVMDGSKRSAHSNAFFTGFGKFRRIVLFDTLIEQLNEEELESVLAHEIGHYKHGHIPKMLIFSAFVALLGFAVIGFLTQAAWFYAAFGFSLEDGVVPALLIFSLFGGVFTFWLSPIMNKRLRKHEYEADDFARAAMNDDPKPLISSLRKMYEKNLSNLTPHPIYSAFHYSHPTLLEREAALNK